MREGPGESGGLMTQPVSGFQREAGWSSNAPDPSDCDHGSNLARLVSVGVGRSLKFKGCSMAFWVVGGVYKDTDFKEIAEEHSEERHGPFGSYDEAYKIWAARAWATVDNAMARFQIVEEPAG
jgi:hypothetical protein